MAGTTKQYVLHAVLLPGSVYIGELTDLTPNQNIEHLTAYAGASVSPSFRAAKAVMPDVTFRTPQVKTILDECGVGRADYSAGNVDLLYRRVDPHGEREAIGSGVHLVIRARRSIMYWTSIEARDDGNPASIEVRILPTFDGSNVPLVGLGTQTIGSNLVSSEEFRLGPVDLNGTDIDGVEGWRLEQQAQPIHKRGDGLVYPTFVGIKLYDPILTVDTPDLDQWVTIGEGLQMTSLEAYLRRHQPDKAIPYANGSAQHIKFSNNDNPCGLVTPNQIGENDGAATTGLRCGLRVSSASTTHPLQVNTASAIT